jgi:hypothetical protein
VLIFQHLFFSSKPDIWGKFNVKKIL